MNISCTVIRDLLPLYHDHVCSEESRELVEKHISSCEGCRMELEEIEREIKMDNNTIGLQTMKSISKRWKRDKLSAFITGFLVVSLIASMSCVITYNVIGSYVAQDGTLVEPFALIPLFFLFAFIAIVSGVLLVIVKVVNRIKQPKEKYKGA